MKLQRRKDYGSGYPKKETKTSVRSLRVLGSSKARRFRVLLIYPTWRLTGSYKWGCKSPNKGYN